MTTIVPIETTQPIGSDGVYLVPVVDATGAVIDLTTYAKVVLFLQKKNDHTTLIKYTTGVDLELYDGVNGWLLFNYKRNSISELTENIKVYYTVKLFKTDTDFEDNTFELESDPQFMAVITKTAGYNENA